MYSLAAVLIVLVFLYFKKIPALFGCHKMEPDNEACLPAVDWTYITDPEYYANYDNIHTPDLIEFDEPEFHLKLTEIHVPELVIDVFDPIEPIVHQFTFKLDRDEVDKWRKPFAVDSGDEFRGFEASISIAIENDDQLNLEAEFAWPIDSDDDGHGMPKTCESLPISIRADVKKYEFLQTTQDPNERESPEIVDIDSDCDSHGYLIPKGVNLTMFPTNAMEYKEAVAELSNDLEIYNENDYDSEESVIPRIVLSAAPKTKDNDPELTSDDEEDNSLYLNLITAGPNFDNASTDNEVNNIIENKSAIGSVIPQLLHFLNPPDSPDSEENNDAGEMPLLGNDFNDQEYHSTPPCLDFIQLPPVQNPRSFIREHQGGFKPTFVQVPAQLPFSDINDYPMMPSLQVPFLENMEYEEGMNPMAMQQPDIDDCEYEGDTEDGEAYFTA